MVQKQASVCAKWCCHVQHAPASAPVHLVTLVPVLFFKSYAQSTDSNGLAASQVACVHKVESGLAPAKASHCTLDQPYGGS